MIEVIIVDDEAAGRRTLREYCAQEADLRVIGEFGDSESAIAAIRARQPQLLFLDVQMDPLNGIELARSLDPAALPSIVFVTAHDGHAVEAFELNAVDYLLKPFDQDRFRKTLARVRPRSQPANSSESQAAIAEILAQLERRRSARDDERPRILAEFAGHLHVLDAATVEMIESDRNYVSSASGVTASTRAARCSRPNMRCARSRCCASAGRASST
jgi:two-component system, LytTR family, response regulator